MGLQNTVRVSIRPTILCLFLTLLSVHCSDSLLKGQISFYASNQIAQLRPLTQQPRIANIKNSLFQFVVIPQKDSCFPLNKSQFQRDTNQPPVIAVMDLTDGRITCGMSNKIARIKQAGGYGFIIVTNDNSFVVNHCKMYDSNSFFTGVMNSENYKILKSQTSTPLVGSLTITPIDNKKKLLEIWTSSLSTASYDELRMLNHVFNKLPTLSQHVEFRVRVALLGCTHGDNPNICSVADNVASCGCRGEFCSPEAHKKAPEVIIKQDIRQMHIFKQDNSKFFPYIKLFQEQCLSKYIESSYSHDCAVNVMNKLEIDSYSVNDEVQSFLDKCSDDKEVKVASQTWIYTSLERDKNAFANYGRYPLILLNKQILEYKNEDDLAGQLCRKMSLQDEGCYQVSSRTVTTVTGMLFYVLLVVILVAIGAGVVYFYRKKLKRDMNKEIKMQVSTAVEHYFALTDVK